MDLTWIIFIFFGLTLLLQFFFFIRSDKRVKANQILVVTGRISEDPTQKFKILTSGATFVWPVIQESFYLNTASRVIQISGRLSLKDGSTRSFVSKLICKIDSKEPEVNRAAELFFKKTENQINELIMAAVQDVMQRELGELKIEEIENHVAVRKRINMAMKAKLADLEIELLTLENFEWT